MQKLIFLSLSLVLLLVHPSLDSNLIDSSIYEIESRFETDDCLITFLTEPSGNKCLIKQIKHSSPDENFLLVLDALGCHIAEKTKISMNRVKIIHANTAFPGKTRFGFPATIHTIAKGQNIENSCCFENLDIHQRLRKENSPLWKQYGPLPPQKRGLTLTVIQNMAKHKDLPSIVALDTFVGNADRSSPNLYYDVETDRFCGIDMAAAFSSKLGQEACWHLENMLQNHVPISAAEKIALSEYLHTLVILINNFPPEKQEQLLLKFAELAGFEEGSHLLDENVFDRIHFHKNCIHNNYENCKKLIIMISIYLSFEEKI